MSMHDSAFEFLPLPGLRWAAPSPTRPLPRPSPNRAFEHAYTLATLPEFHAWADGSYTLRVYGRCGDQPLCRVYLCTLPDRSRIGVIENVQDDHQDPLTGLETRRALWLDAAHVKDESLALLDVDGFKTVNDAHGHAAGDAVLVTLADLLRASARTWGARAYRLGGDEFVVLGAGPLNAGQLREVQAPFRRAAARLGLSVLGFSCGLAHAPHDGQTLCELLEQADARLGVQKINRRGAMAAQVLQHLQQQSEAETSSAGHAPHPEAQPFQMSWPTARLSRPLRAENR